MSKQVVKVVGDTDTNVIRYEATDNTSEELAEFLMKVVDHYQGELKKSRADKTNMVKQVVSDRGDAARFERLSKSVSDRELSRYYAERAKELKG